jgi:hypothetical protein
MPCSSPAVRSHRLTPQTKLSTKVRGLSQLPCCLTTTTAHPALRRELPFPPAFACAVLWTILSWKVQSCLVHLAALLPSSCFSQEQLPDRRSNESDPIAVVRTPVAVMSSVRRWFMTRLREGLRARWTADDCRFPVVSVVRPGG